MLVIITKIYKENVISLSILYAIRSGFGFYIINPWRPRIDQVIRRILEAGMIEKWKERAWYRMKEEHQRGLEESGEEGIHINIKPLIAPLTMDDFQVDFTAL